MAVVYFMRQGDKLVMSEKQQSFDNSSKKRGIRYIGFPQFILEAKGLLSAEGDDIEKMMGVMEENKSYKMVLLKWPIE